MFRKAERRKAKLRLALSGPSGSGKTWGALQLAKGIGGRVAVLDTERRSASLYAGTLLDFDVAELSPPYTPERYIEVIQEAAKAGYDVLILDSITHEWSGQGGILQIVDEAAKARYRGNSQAAWSEGTPRHQKFVDAMVSAPLHIIATMRTKSVYVETEKDGKKRMEKQGTAPQQRDGMEYEFTTMLELVNDGHYALASKDRTGLFLTPRIIEPGTGQILLEWLEQGVEPFDLDGALRAIADAVNMEALKDIYERVKHDARRDGLGVALNRATERRRMELLAIESRWKTVVDDDPAVLPVGSSQGVPPPPIAPAAKIYCLDKHRDVDESDCPPCPKRRRCPSWE